MYSKHSAHAEDETSHGTRRPERSTMPAKKMNEPSATCQFAFWHRMFRNKVG